MNPLTPFKRHQKYLASTAFIISSFAALVAPAALAAVNTLVPVSYTTITGTSGGQAVATSIAIQDLTGAKDSWNKYVEFGPNGSQPYNGFQSFSLPTAITPASITGMQVKVNYRGPNSASQTWTWKIFNWNTNSYVTVGTNASAPAWGNWTVLQFNIAGTFANYVRSTDGRIQIGLSANNTADSTDIDYEAVIVTSGDTTSSAPSSTPISAASSSKSSVKSSAVSSIKSSALSSLLQSSKAISSTTTLSSIAASSASSSSGTKIGVISYWGTDTNLYNLLPENSTALINPESGIFSAQSQTIVQNVTAFSSIVATASARHVNMLAYIPTGYFNHTCNVAGQCQTWTRIEAQVQAYFQYMPQLAGVFFDEAAPSQWDCNAFAAEYKKLRDIVHKYNTQAKIAFNAGVPDNCVVNGAAEGEITVLFESDQASFVAQAQNIKVSTATALSKGVIPWNLVYSVKTVEDLNTIFATAKSNGVALFYATDIGGNWQAGENTWGSLPPYWAQEVNLMK